MSAILDDGQDPNDAAKSWLQTNSSILNGWLEGVTTFDGGNGLSAVQASLN